MNISIQNVIYWWWMNFGRVGENLWTSWAPFKWQFFRVLYVNFHPISSNFFSVIFDIAAFMCVDIIHFTKLQKLIELKERYIISLHFNKLCREECGRWKKGQFHSLFSLKTIPNIYCFFFLFQDNLKCKLNRKIFTVRT